MTAPSLNRRPNIQVFEKNTALLLKVRRYFCVYSQQQGLFKLGLRVIRTIACLCVQVTRLLVEVAVG